MRPQSASWVPLPTCLLKRYLWKPHHLWYPDTLPSLFIAQPWLPPSLFPSVLLVLSLFLISLQAHPVRNMPTEPPSPDSGLSPTRRSHNSSTNHVHHSPKPTAPLSLTRPAFFTSVAVTSGSLWTMVTKKGVSRYHQASCRVRRAPSLTNGTDQR